MGPNTNTTLDHLVGNITFYNTASVDPNTLTSYLQVGKREKAKMTAPPPSLPGGRLSPQHAQFSGTNAVSLAKTPINGGYCRQD